MKSKFRTRIAALGATVALATGAVLVATPAAQATLKSATAGYTCQSDFGPQSFDIKTTVDLPAQVKKGKSVPGKAAKLTASISPATADLLRSFGIQAISITASAVKFTVGTTKVGVAGVKSPSTAVPATGGFKVIAKGKAASFKMTKTGTYKVKAPRAFTFNIFQHSAESPDGTPLLAGLGCVVDAGENTTIGSLKVVN